jgi:hypothetical protein
MAYGSWQKEWLFSYAGHPIDQPQLPANLKGDCVPVQRCLPQHACLCAQPGDGQALHVPAIKHHSAGCRVVET